MRILIVSAICLFSTNVYAGRQQFCEVTNYSADEIATAVRNSVLRDELKGTACSLGGLGRYESAGNKGIFNGTCCTGIFQLNRRNIFNFTRLTPREFGCASLEFQVDAWARLTNAAYNSPVVRRLMALGTFDGQRVDPTFIAACIQLGVGNCQRMVDSGRCSGFADSNGTTICDMARQARSLQSPTCREDEVACRMGPGDFSPSPTPVAENPPPILPTDVLVSAMDL